jgi:hypothetical protein
MKTISIFVFLVNFGYSCKGQDSCNVKFIEISSYKGITFKIDTNCKFNEKLFDLNKDSVILNYLHKNESNFEIENMKSTEVELPYGKAVFFSTIYEPYFYVGIIKSGSFQEIKKIQVDSSDDLRGFDTSLNISLEYILERRGNDFILYNILSEEGGSFKIKVSIVMFQNEKISIKQIFLSPFLMNYYNNSYCEGCTFFQKKKGKIFLKISPAEFSDPAEDLNLKKYQKLIPFSLDWKTKTILIDKEKYIFR